MSIDHLSTTRFSDLGLTDALLQAIHAAGYTQCTPIQAQALPLLLQGQDVAGQAQTGTGKTIAFLVATFDHLLRHPLSPERQGKSLRALILAPTRELAVQIHRDAVALATPLGIRLGLVYGGADYDKQRATIEAGVDVLIGTPGRAIDYFKQHVFNLKALQVCVLDEADRMFDLGFIKDIRFVLRRMPPVQQRLSMLFSATLSHRVTELAYEHMNNPKLVQIVSDSVTAERVTQSVYYTANEEKIPLLIGLLRRLQPSRSIVFVNTKRMVDVVSDYLQANGFSAAQISGDIPQERRLRLLNRFQNGELNILVATDVAARGLHIPQVSHVFNFDLPQSAEDYVHRIGRTARAGASGTAISFACEDYAFHLPEIEEYIGAKLPAQPIDPALLVTPEKPERRERSHGPRPGQGRGGRPPRRGEGKAAGTETRPAAEGAPPKKRRRRRRSGPPAPGQG